MRRSAPFLILLLSGCLPPTSPSEDLAFSTAISSPVFKSGDPITIRITVTNHGSKTRTLMGDACQNSFSVINGANQVVAPGSRVCTAAVYARELKFNETYVFVHQWNGETTAAGSSTVTYLAPASYRLRGFVSVEGQQLTSPEAIVRITP